MAKISPHQTTSHVTLFRGVVAGRQGVVACPPPPSIMFIEKVDDFHLCQKLLHEHIEYIYLNTSWKMSCFSGMCFPRASPLTCLPRDASDI